MTRSKTTNPQSAIRNPQLVVGLIGGIGSGKSQVAKMFAAHGGLIIQGDDLGHEALRQPAIRDQVITRFGPGILDNTGEIVRRKLAERVFTDTAELRKLEEIVFPYIRERAEALMAEAQTDPMVRFIVLDAAVMMEAGWNSVCDRIVYIHAPRAVRLARLAHRGWIDAQLEARERAQWPLAEKARHADAAIDNSGGLDETARQVEKLLQEWNLVSVAAASSRRDDWRCMSSK